HRWPITLVSSLGSTSSKVLRHDSTEGARRNNARRSRSVIPPQTPYWIRLSSASTKHSNRTGQSKQISRACRCAAPRTNNSSGERWAHNARRVHSSSNLAFIPHLSSSSGQSHQGPSLVTSRLIVRVQTVLSASCFSPCLGYTTEIVPWPGLVLAHSVSARTLEAMPSSSRPGSRTVNAAQLVSMFLAFLLVAGVGEVLSAGFMMPAAASLGAVTDAGKRLFEDLPTELGSQEMSEQSVIYAADGSVLARLFRWNRIVVPLDEISEHVQDAVVATEDRRFYEHGGVDPEGILRAAVANLMRTSTQGGSTLTQQYVKNVLVEAGRRSHDAEAIQAATAPTLGRKLREAKLAIALENHDSKDEILQGYLNIAQFGPSTWGVEAASRYYFSKHASELTIAQSAMLAGITQSPAKWDPVR